MGKFWGRLNIARRALMRGWIFNAMGWTALAFGAPDKLVGLLAGDRSPPPPGDKGQKDE